MFFPIASFAYMHTPPPAALGRPWGPAVSTISHGLWAIAERLSPTTTEGISPDGSRTSRERVFISALREDAV